MQKIIEGKLYDTDKAQLLGKWENGENYSDSRWYCEDLYQTEKGTYFVAGRGHASSPYSEHCGGMRGPGEGITPMSRKEAFQWAQRKLDSKDVINLFGDMVEEA